MLQFWSRSKARETSESQSVPVECPFRANFRWPIGEWGAVPSPRSNRIRGERAAAPFLMVESFQMHRSLYDPLLLGPLGPFVAFRKTDWGYSRSPAKHANARISEHDSLRSRVQAYPTIGARPRRRKCRLEAEEFPEVCSCASPLPSDLRPGPPAFRRYP